MELTGRTALVTGAGRRVGRAIAVALGRARMRVVVHYHTAEAPAKETVRLIEEAGSAAALIAADLRLPGEPERVVREAARKFREEEGDGRLDVLVNSAAVMQRTPLGEVAVAAWDDIFALNVRAPFFAAQAAAEIMGERGGVIVNIADLAGLETWPAYIPHGISKHAVIHMTRSLARALAPKIRVNAVAPGAVLLPESWDAAAAERLTRTTPLGRLGTPDDVSSAVLYLLTADYVTGETLIVDGGRHIRL